MIRFLYDNLLEPPQTIIASSEDSYFPKENILHPFRTKVWKSAGVSGEFLKGDLGENKAVSVIAVANHNFDSGGTYKFQMNDTDVWTAPAVDETLVVPSGSSNGLLIKYFGSVSRRWWRFLMTNTVAPDVQMGRPFIGTYLEPSRNFYRGWKDKPVDRSIHSESIGGQNHSDIKSMVRQFQIQFKLVKDSEKYNDFLAMVKAVGTYKRIFVSLDPDSYLDALSFYGRFLNTPEFVNTLFQRHEFGLMFRECL